MIYPLLQKLKSIESLENIEPLLNEIDLEFQKINFPNAEMKLENYSLLIDSLKTYVTEFDDRALREYNKSNLDTFIFLDKI
ncbi:MAG: hypothetical protein CMH47_18525 [Muricauda sp.]|nr:hypothetical protein [uncultured Allomuricauda sp.]MBC74220.1 hypothetical protein [Allomuricauda sp.]|tara:strand:- start:1687 stop:1929 length:243 start_codon:yes stop_codon:yes gene_type:complete